MDSIDPFGLVVPVAQDGGRMALRWRVLRSRTGAGESDAPVALALCALSDLAGAMHGAVDRAKAVTSPLTATALRDAALVVCPHGSFVSSDRLDVVEVNARSPAWTIDVDVLRQESQDGEPAPATMTLLLALDPGERPLRSLALRFRGVRRGFDGVMTAFDAPPEVRIEFQP
jgi:hypothetical protein